MGEYVTTERDGRVAVVTIDNPPVNALKAALLEELEAELAALDADGGIGAIVVRGAGERAFVAGADIKEFPALREAPPAEGGSARGIQKVGFAIDAMRTPVIAQIHGFCLGGGLELAMACDIRVAADDAQLGQPEIKLGLIPGGGGTQRLPRLAGRGRAMLLNLTGDPIPGSVAADWGIVDRAVPLAELAETALADRADDRLALAGGRRRPEGARGRDRATCRSPRGSHGRRRASAAASRARTGSRA